MQSNTYLRAMSTTRIAPRPRDLFFALLQGAAAAHTAFIVVLTWLRPDLGFGAIVSLMLLPLLAIAAGFLPVVMILALIRVAVVSLAAPILARPLLLTAALAVAGIVVATAVAWFTTMWLPDEEIVSSLLFGAGVGGVVAGMRLGPRKETDEHAVPPGGGT